MIKIILIGLVLIGFSSCSLNSLRKYDNTPCENSIFSIKEEMILLENAGSYGREYLHAITRNSLKNYQDYLKHMDITFDEKGMNIKGTNISKMGIPKQLGYPHRHFKELKLYKIGSSFKIISFYYWYHPFSSTSEGTAYYLLQSLEDESKMWIPAFMVNPKNSCSIGYNSTHYHFEKSVLINYQYSTTDASLQLKDRYEMNDKLYEVSRTYLNENLNKIVEENQIKKIELKHNLYRKILNGEIVTSRMYKKYGLDINERFYNGQTGLILAVINNNRATVSNLLNSGADIGIVDDFDNNALSYADKNTTMYLDLRIQDTIDKYREEEPSIKNIVVEYDKKTDKVIVRKHE